MDLANIPTDELAKELLGRDDLVDENGVWSFNLYKLQCLIAIIPCTDGVAVRRGENGIEALAIRRGTGVFQGRLCSVGGRLIRGESLEECLRRQFRADLGVEIEMLTHWKNPVDIGQAAPLENPLTDEWPKDFGPEDRKHTISNYYVVKILGDLNLGETTYGGQEARSVEWHTLATLPGPDEFGYDQHPKFVACLKAAEQLI